MDRESWISKLEEVSLEMLKYGDPCSVTDELHLVWEDGRELVLDLLENGSVLARGITRSYFDGPKLTEPRSIGSSGQTPFEIARTISLKVLEPYTKEYEAAREKEGRKTQAVLLNNQTAQTIMGQSRTPITFRAEEDGICLIIPGGTVLVQEDGFKVNAFFGVPPEKMIDALRILMS
jgi:hypothetical protein